MANSLNWGIIGAGRIAGTFARGVAKSKTGKLLAVASRSQDKADAFGRDFGLPRCYGSYDALLADPDVQAVYIATPHPQHAEWAIKAAQAGKGILCEKPLAINFAEAMAIVDAARRHSVFLMEAFMYRCHPQTARLVELVRQKAVGEVRIIRATFSFHAGFSADSRLFANALAGGGILDVGCYPVSAARLLAGAAMGKDFAEPLEVKAAGHLGQTGVDEWAVADLKFPGDILAQLSTGISLNQDNQIIIFGSEGQITVPWPWIPAREGGTVKIILKRNADKEPQEIAVATDEHLYGLEADAVAAGWENKQAAPPAMTIEDSLGNMRVLDAWRAQIGLTYDSEKPENVLRTVTGKPLAVTAGNNMKYGQVAGVEKKISRLVMGCDNQPTMPHMAVVLDDFFERGGNAFDTAVVYGGGKSERLLGQWVRNRGLREQVVILDKGAHTPFCTPEFLASQFKESLGRLGLDYVDIYLMHRDNPAVPVGEFIDALNELKSAGQVRAFGGSNWSLERIRKANDYARRKGLAGFAAISNNLSLAEMVQAPWDGCLSCSDKAFRQWLKKTQLPEFSWSSQAQGYFADQRPAGYAADWINRCWHSEDNARRRERVLELAAKRGVSPMTIALAWVLSQAFPTFALVGPRVLWELDASLAALDVELSPRDLAWLNLER